MSKRTKRTRITRRRLLGLNITGASSNSPPLVHAIYEEEQIEQMTFTTKVVRGSTIHVNQHSGMLNGSKKEKAYHLKSFRPDLWASIQAAAILYQQLEHACVELDEAHGMKEF